MTTKQRLSVFHAAGAAKSQYLKSVNPAGIYLISLGEINKYEQQSSKVIALLISKGLIPIIVTEKVSKMYCQVMRD